MSSLAQVTPDVLRGLIAKSIADVLKTMLSMEAQVAWVSADHPGEDPPPLGGALPHVAGTVGFLGEINGLIYLHMEGEFARLATSRLLGMSPQEVDAEGEEVVNDAVGEITNMTVGGFKNALCDMGMPCKLTIPSILRGRNFTVEPVSSATRLICQFEVEGHRVTADLLMKLGD